MMNWQDLRQKQATRMGALRHRFAQAKTWVVIVLAIGVFFRFFNLDHKVYWYDETQTSLRISGYTSSSMTTAVYDGRIIRNRELLERFQYPNKTRDLHDSLAALAGSPEHAPLYFLTARFWLQLFGHSIGTIRVLSALISLLALPAMYWLCQELFQAPAIAWAAVLLVATSPFHVLYAQEARQYSLWIVTILISSAALLRALRLQTRVSWAAYILAAAIGLYTHLFSVLILVSHGIYVALTERRRQLRHFVGAIAVALLLFAPWLWVVIDKFERVEANTASVGVDRDGLPLLWGLNLSRLFFDFNQGPSWINPITYLLVALVGYAFYVLCRQAPQRASLFVITLVGVTGMALIGPDLLLGGRRSSIPRYAIPCLLGIQIAVAYLLTTKLVPSRFLKASSTQASSTQAKSTQAVSAQANPPAGPAIITIQQGQQIKRTRKQWRSITIALLLSGILSCAVSSQASVWWHKSHSKSRYNPDVAKVINRSDRPLVISDQNPGMVLSLAHLLDSDVRLQLIQAPLPPLSSEFATLYVYRPSNRLRDTLQHQPGLKLEPAYRDWLWKISR